MDLSILVPVYNKADFVVRFLSSFKPLSTSLKLELIFIDDGSLDESGILINQLSKDLNLNIEYIYQKNQGVSAARNNGLLHAKGDYIWFVDPDDVLDITHIDNLVFSLSEAKADILFFGYNVFLDEKLVNEIKFDRKEFKPSDDFVNMAVNHTIETVWNKIMRREFIVENHLFFDAGLSYAEDFIFIMQILSCNPKVILSDIVSYNYFKNKNSLSNTFIDNELEVRRRIFDAYVSYADKQSIDILPIKDLFIIESFSSSAKNRVSCDKVFTYDDVINEAMNSIEIAGGNKIKTNFNSVQLKVASSLINLKLYKLLVIILCFSYRYKLKQ